MEISEEDVKEKTEERIVTNAWVPEVFLLHAAIACKQALRGVPAAGWENEGELATTSLEIESRLQFPCGTQSTELTDFRQSARM